MSEPNSFLEFLGILGLMIAVMAIAGTLIQVVYEKTTEKIEKSNNIKKVIKEDIKTTVQNSFNEFDKVKMDLNFMFYDFCFCKETAETFLTENKNQRKIITGLILFQFESEQLVEKILKIFFKKKFDFELGDSSFNTYKIRGYKFYIDVTRINNDKGNGYFEILYNDFNNVTDEQNKKIAIAKNFILYCENNKPKAIFVLVYDPILKKHFLSRVYENGRSISLTGIKDVESQELILYLKSYILKLT